MKRHLVLYLLICLTVASVTHAQDTLWIDPTLPGALETTINGDITLDGARKNPNRIYALHKDAVYVQNRGIVFKGGSTLTIVGEKGGAYPVVQMRPVNGVDQMDPIHVIANSVEGSLHLDHVYWIGKTTAGTLYTSMFYCTTVNALPQSMVVNDCVLEFGGIDWVTADGWDHGAKFIITNCYYRDLFWGQQWWSGRVFYCKRPIDSLWVENTTFTDGGMVFLQQNALCRFAYFNHNTFINTNKYWLLSCSYLSLYITNNLFVNQNWVGEDTVNVTTSGQDPDSLLMGTINIDSIRTGILMQPEFRNPDGTVNQTIAGPGSMKMFVSNNISWTDTLLNAYYTNRNNVWNSVGPYPLSYLAWGGKGIGPWQVKNVPGIWANKRTLGLFAAYPHNMAMKDNIFTRVNTVTPAIAHAGIATLMGQWNQDKWNDPAWPLPPDLLHSAYTFGDQDPGTIPGYKNSVKTEDGDVGISKFSDFVENFSQAGTPVLSNIDNVPIGSLAWNDQTVPADAYAKVLTAFQKATDYVPPPPPPAPVATSATDISWRSFTANWSSSVGATGYLLDVATDSAFALNLANFHNLDVGYVLARSVTGLAGGTKYFYRVRGNNEGGPSGNSGIISVTTAAAPPPPPAPVATSATYISSASFTANWDSSLGATGYLLDVAADTAFTSVLANYHNLSAGKALAQSVTGLQGVTRYFYRIRAGNDGGTSENSNVISVTTAAAPDTLWIDANTPGALETTINADTAAGGVRAHALRVYGLHKDGVYVQIAGIVFKGGATLTIVGEKGGAYPVVQMQPVHGVDPGDLTNGIANKVEGSLHLDHIYWLGKTTDGTQYNQLFNMSTMNNLSQSCVVNDCVTEFIGLDTFNGDGWTHGAKWKFTNSYFRALFNGGQWWAGRVMCCKKPIDTLWVENCTVTGGGLLFLQQEAVTRFAYFNHNTFINSTKTWLLNEYYQNLFVVNNIFINHNWVGEDTVNVTTGGQDPDTSRMSTINLDTITIRQQLPPDMINPDSTADQSKVGLDKLHIFVSNNISWTDTLLNSYYTNRNHRWNAIAPYPLSYLDWSGKGTGPWPVTNIPGLWMNKRTAALFAAYPHNMAMTHNIFTRVDTRTPAIKDASIVDLMGAWNQNMWGDPAYPITTTDLLMSAYVPGDKDANTLPGFTNGVKSEDSQSARVAKVSDFIENYAQSGTKIHSTIDRLAIGALQWDDQTVPAASFSQIMAASWNDVIIGVTEAPGVVQSFSLGQNFPNPFNPTTTIEYHVGGVSAQGSGGRNVRLVVYDVLGREVSVLVNEIKSAGTYQVRFDGGRLASGVYFYRLTAGSFVATKKMIMTR